MATITQFPTDGRIQRSERSRTAIVQAMLELIGEGSLSPTAQQVARRADVGVRTVFRHFSDMETLFSTMNEQLKAEVDSLFIEEVQEGSFSERVEALIESQDTGDTIVLHDGHVECVSGRGRDVPALRARIAQAVRVHTVSRVPPRLPLPA